MSGRSRAHTRSLSRSSHLEEVEPGDERAPTSMQYDDPSMLIAPPPSARVPSRSGSAMSREMGTHEFCERDSVTSASRHEDLSSRSAGSRRSSSKMSQRSKHDEILSMDYNFQGRRMPLRSKSASNRHHQNETNSGSRNPSKKESRPFSAPICIPGDETNVTLATLGSEANIDDVKDVISRHQSFVEASDNERDLDSPDVAWPVDVEEGLVASDDESGGYGSAAEGMNFS